MNIYPLSVESSTIMLRGNDGEFTPLTVESCPIESARMLGDEHIIKMPIEALQTVCTALYERRCPEHLMPFTKGGTRYRASHKHHPVVKWCGETYGNMKWTLEWTIAMLVEYTHRYGKVHAVEDSITNWVKSGDFNKALHYMNIADRDNWVMTPFAQAMPETYQTLSRSIVDVVHAYRRYYASKTFKNGKRPSYKHTTPPEWFTEVA